MRCTSGNQRITGPDWASPCRGGELSRPGVTATLKDGCKCRSAATVLHLTIQSVIELCMAVQNHSKVASIQIAKPLFFERFEGT